MLRRLFLAALRPGPVALDRAEAHHARDVLRLPPGTPVELFDDAGRVGFGRLAEVSARDVIVDVERVDGAPASVAPLTVAAAVPKGERADWMIEKLSELGVDRFVPLAAARSVVLPEGKNKVQRWARIATESAKQSRRRGVLRIDPLTPLATLLGQVDPGRSFCLSTADDAVPAGAVAEELRGTAPVVLFIGPEGGWTDDELATFAGRAVRPVALTDTVLRVETAAIAAAAVFAILRPPPG